MLLLLWLYFGVFFGLILFCFQSSVRRFLFVVKPIKCVLYAAAAVCLWVINKKYIETIIIIIIWCNQQQGNNYIIENEFIFDDFFNVMFW